MATCVLVAKVGLAPVDVDTATCRNVIDFGFDVAQRHHAGRIERADTFHWCHRGAVKSLHSCLSRLASSVALSALLPKRLEASAAV